MSTTIDLTFPEFDVRKQISWAFAIVLLVSGMSLAAWLSQLAKHPALAPAMPEGNATSAAGVAQAAPAELLPKKPVRPRVLFTDVEAGPNTGGPDNLGVPISIFGTGFGHEQGSSRVTIGGVEVARYLAWGSHNAHNSALDMIIVQPGPKIAGGALQVTVEGRASNDDFSFGVSAGSVLAIAPSGSDSKPCSLQNPCSTVLHAIQISKPGDTILLRAGNYAEGEIWIRSASAGSLKLRKTIKNYPNEEVFFTNPARDFLVDADYITVSGLNFRNGKGLQMAGWASRDQRGDRFINNTFTGTINWAASETTGHDHLLAGNVCDIAGATTGTMGHCYYITQGSNLKILYNVAKGAPGYGLHIYEERRESSDFKRVIRDVLVEGNLLVASKQRSGMIISVTDAGGYGNHIDGITVRNNIFAHNNHAGLIVIGSVHNVRIFNNTFYQNGRLGIYVESDPKIAFVDIRNNLIYQSTNDHCVVDCSVLPQVHAQIGDRAEAVTLSNNSYHPGSPNISGIKDKSPSTGAVKFADDSRLDFHLRSATGHGVGIQEASLDFDGRKRTPGEECDTGAFQARD